MLRCLEGKGGLERSWSRQARGGRRADHGRKLEPPLDQNRWTWDGMGRRGESFLSRELWGGDGKMALVLDPLWLDVGPA